MKTFFFTAAQRREKCLLVSRRKEKAFKHLGDTEFGPVRKCGKFSFGSDIVNHRQSKIGDTILLAIVPYRDRRCSLDTATIRFDISCQYVDKCRLPHPIWSDYPDTFTIFEVVRKTLDNNFARSVNVFLRRQKTINSLMKRKRFMQFMNFNNFVSEPSFFEIKRQCHRCFFSG